MGTNYPNPRELIRGHTRITPLETYYPFFSHPHLLTSKVQPYLNIFQESDS